MYRNAWEKTGILAVDMVATTVTFYRDRKMPLKTIYLRPKLFVQFCDFVKYKQKDEEEVKEILEYTFDGVVITMNSPLMGEKTYCDFYDQKEEGQKYELGTTKVVLA